MANGYISKTKNLLGTTLKLLENKGGRLCSTNVNTKAANTELALKVGHQRK